MTTWQIQQAKENLGQLIEESKSDGPQIITRRGIECAVVLSIADYQALKAGKLIFRDYLLGGAKLNNFEIIRDKDLGREIDLH